MVIFRALLLIMAFSFSCSEKPELTPGSGDPCKEMTCQSGEVCYAGSCFGSCDDSTDCDSSSQKCFQGRCAAQPCDGVTCPPGQKCMGGTCFDSCVTSEECSFVSQSCLEGTCRQDSCDGWQCPAGMSCMLGICFETCRSDTDCDLGLCFDGRCTQDPCELQTCQPDQACYLGACFETCETEVDCQEGHLCYSGRCATSACQGISCSVGQTCVEGECAKTCRNSDECDEDSACLEGVCTGPNCSDGILNGTETDVDCGGSCAACGVGQTCGSPNDCGAAEVSDWSECVFPADACAESGTQMRTVKSYPCVESICGENTEEELQNCARQTAGMVCDDGNPCTHGQCAGGDCASQPFCAGTTQNCGCSTCEDCSTGNAWVNVGAAYACCQGGSRCTSCQNQEYRTFSCNQNSCGYTVTDTRTQRNNCAACNDGNSCTNDSCSNGVCQASSICAGTTSSCGCSSCTSCPSSGWYNTGSAYTCCNGRDRCTACQDQRYRTYSCSGTSCTYTNGSTRTIYSSCSSCINQTNPDCGYCSVNGCLFNLC